MISLEAIAIRSASRAPMQELPVTTISTSKGVEGDSRGKPGKRQVTVMSQESWHKTCADLNIDLPWTTRRANLLVSGVEFGPQDVGKILVIGDAQLEITREADPCRRMDEAQPGLKQALVGDWRGGVCCRVLQAGQIRIGDRVNLVKQ